MRSTRPSPAVPVKPAGTAGGVRSVGCAVSAFVAFEEIDAILRDSGVPLLNDMGTEIKAEG